MVVGTAAELVRVRDAVSARRWAAQLVECEPGHRLVLIERLLQQLARADMPPEAMLEVVEQARRWHVEALNAAFGAVQDRPVPIGRDQLAQFGHAGRGLRVARNLYRQIYTLMVDDLVGTNGKLDGPRATLPPRLLVPLARALDLQSRLLVAYQRARLEVPEEEWDEFCRLGSDARASGALDEPIADPRGAGRRSWSCRELFVYPLLLRAAEPEELSGDEIAYVLRLARRLAGRVGFRIDWTGVSLQNLGGPVLDLSQEHRVRLDTRKVLRAIERRSQELGDEQAIDESPAPGLDIDQALALLRRLQWSWSADYSEPRVFPPPAEAAHVSFGWAAEGADATAAEPEAPGRGLRYQFGAWRRENNLKPLFLPHHAQLLARQLASAEQLRWMTRSARVAYFERDRVEPRLELGMLALVRALQSQGEDAAGSTSGPVLGAVLSLGQSASNPPARGPLHHVGIALWQGRPVPLQAAVDQGYFESAYLLLPEVQGEHAPVLVLCRPGAAVGTTVTLRDRGDEGAARLERLIDAGPHFERWAVTLID